MAHTEHGSLAYLLPFKAYTKGKKGRAWTGPYLGRNGVSDLLEGNALRHRLPNLPEAIFLSKPLALCWVEEVGPCRDCKGGPGSPRGLPAAVETEPALSQLAIPSSTYQHLLHPHTPHGALRVHLDLGYTHRTPSVDFALSLFSSSSCGLKAYCQYQCNSLCASVQLGYE